MADVENPPPPKPSEPAQALKAPKKGGVVARKLTVNELEWVKRFDFLEQAGYRLRPRYKPGWEPSWKLGETSLNHEDSIFLDTPKLIDATRLSDGMTVMLKCIPDDTEEAAIGLYLSSEELRQDPRNHAAPILAVLRDPSDTDYAIVVMPLLRRVDAPLPQSVREAVEFVDQLLEGMAFMHEHQIAHRDSAWGNVMMDGRRIFPGGWHPQSPELRPDGKHVLPDTPSSRTSVGGVRYYFIDFGISSRGLDSVTGADGQEEAPELSATKPYNPFKLDVYVLGMAFHHFLLKTHGRLEFMQPLVDYMTPEDPNTRPSIVEVVIRFQEIRSKLTKKDLSQRLTPNELEPKWTRLWNDLLYLALIFLSPPATLKSSPTELVYRCAKDSSTTFPLPEITAAPKVSLSVIVPAFNETLRLKPMLTAAITHLSSLPASSKRTFEIIVVDDCSKDATTSTALEFAKQNPKIDIRVVTFARNRGKGGAVQHGVLHCRGERVLMVDADGASKFSDLEKLWVCLDEVESGEHGVAVGSRAHMVNSEAVVKRSFLRNCLMYAFHALLRTVGVSYIHDTQCGFKLFTRSSARVLFQSLHLHGWVFDVELLLLAQRLDIPVVEVPIEWQEIDGSKMSLMRDSINMGKDVLLLRANYTIGRWRAVDDERSKKN
ncbi:dolichyl-phosphate beta-glucosyltransferase [Tulasnella sp. 330]|nr:dolichyl-phosphate beta-glucosyltransferase [Tulasnella sp. 330]KAG8883861.1 dolichyl-phosphate beta-glucosyltransferase [Tulasnella sp. 331]